MKVILDLLVSLAIIITSLPIILQLSNQIFFQLNQLTNLQNQLIDAHKVIQFHLAKVTLDNTLFSIDFIQLGSDTNHTTHQYKLSFDNNKSIFYHEKFSN